MSVILENEKINDTDNEDVIYAKVLGIISGIGNNNFNPNADITREEAAILLYRLAKYTGEEVNYEKHRFKDYENISSWAKKQLILFRIIVYAH